MCLSPTAKGRAPEWLPNHFFPWNLLGRQMIGTMRKRRLTVPESPWKHNWGFCHQLPRHIFSTWGRWCVGRYCGYSSLQETEFVCRLSECKQEREILKGKKRLLGEPLSDLVTVIYFSIWPKAWGPPWDTTTTFWWHILLGFRLVLEHMHLAMERESGRGREEPAGWQRNTLGMNCILILTLPQAVLPDGREFERRQL